MYGSRGMEFKKKKKKKRGSAGNRTRDLIYIR